MLNEEPTIQEEVSLLMTNLEEELICYCLDEVDGLGNIEQITKKLNQERREKPQRKIVSPKQNK